MSKDERNFILWYGCTTLLAAGLFVGVVVVIIHFLMKFW